MAGVGQIQKHVDVIGEQIRDLFLEFLVQFEVTKTDDDGNVVQYQHYVKYIETMAVQESTTLPIDYQHLIRHSKSLAVGLSEEYLRFEPYLRQAVSMAVGQIVPDFQMIDATARIAREFHVGFFNFSSVAKLRELKMSRVGQLCSVTGTVTRTSEVRPELHFGVFTCKVCAAESEPVEQQFKYTEPVQCRNRGCNNSKEWTLLPERSRFVDWQRVRVQENSDEIPAGSMPRAMDIILRHSQTERAKAGDKVTFTGCLIVVPDVSSLYRAGAVPTSQSRGAGGNRAGGGEGVTGLRALGVRDLSYRTAFLAQTVASSSDRTQLLGEEGEGDAGGEDSYASMLSPAKKEAFQAMSQGGTVYMDLVRSIAPTIHGHDTIKKGILLQLLGGVHKRTPEGIRLRGDINVCIVGDPSTAKSQFLKYVARFMPRSVYTSGKASSAAGLTASIAKDPDTGEFTIEAGALMLADNGVCCIDEFDKMDPNDQVAIHEAMEQQTISITKAGIQATLNARASILAAANPIWGRYDTTKTLRQNVAIGAPIMSRFDLFAVVLDTPDEANDIRIAQHIVSVHRFGRAAILPAGVDAQMKELEEKGWLSKAKEGDEADDGSTPGKGKRAATTSSSSHDGSSSSSPSTNARGERQGSSPTTEGGRGPVAADSPARPAQEQDAGVNEWGLPLPKYTLEELQGYVRYARSITPRFTLMAQEAVVQAYQTMRQDDSTGASKASYRITVRQLEALIRLSEALARLHLDPIVRSKYVDEAARLLKKSILQVANEDVDLAADDALGDWNAQDEAALLAMEEAARAADAVRRGAGGAGGSPGPGGKRDDDDDMDGAGATGAGAGAAAQSPQQAPQQQTETAAEQGGAGGKGAGGKQKLQIDAAKYMRIERVYAQRLHAQQKAQEVNDADKADEDSAEAEALRVSALAEAARAAALSMGAAPPPSPARASMLPVRLRAQRPEDYALSGADLVDYYMDSMKDILEDEEAYAMEREVAVKALWRLVSREQKFRVVSAKPLDPVTGQPVDYAPPSLEGAEGLAAAIAWSKKNKGALPPVDGLMLVLTDDYALPELEGEEAPDMM